MNRFFGTHFVEKFTIMAFICLLGYVWYCTAMNIKTDSVRDAWNILILIAGFIWGSAAKQNKKTEPGTPRTITVPEQEIETQKPNEETP